MGHKFGLDVIQTLVIKIGPVLDKINTLLTILETSLYFNFKRP
jgi:hypothetical protein